jgi:hypothetical protein
MICDPEVQFGTSVHKFSGGEQHMSALVQEVTPSDLQLREPAFPKTKLQATRNSLDG